MANWYEDCPLGLNNVRVLDHLGGTLVDTQINCGSSTTLMNAVLRACADKLSTDARALEKGCKVSLEKNVITVSC
jgi:hypothetical protein